MPGSHGPLSSLTLVAALTSAALPAQAHEGHRHTAMGTAKAIESAQAYSLITIGRSSERRRILVV